MRLHILSDLHLEFGDFSPPKTNADVVVLAGDIHLKGRGVHWAEQSFPGKPVIYVPGNHEYYKGNFPRTFRKMVDAAGKNVRVVDKETVIIEDVRFICATLWSDFRLTGNQPIAMWDAQCRISDYKRIRFGSNFHRLRPSHLLAENGVAVRFIEEELTKPFVGKTVVVTHHAPCELSIPARFKSAENAPLNPAYASRLERLFGEHLNLWVHGHIHNAIDYELYGTRVIANPRGYSGSELVDGFNPALTIEI